MLKRKRKFRMAAEGFDVLHDAEVYAYEHGHGLVGTGVMLLQCILIDRRVGEAVQRAQVDLDALAAHVTEAGPDGEHPPGADTKDRLFRFPAGIVQRAVVPPSLEAARALERVRTLTEDADVRHIAYALITAPDSAAGRIAAAMEKPGGAAEYELRIILDS